jgi:hypothetical protein
MAFYLRGYVSPRSAVASPPATDNAIHQTAEEWIGKQSQDRRHN